MVVVGAVRGGLSEERHLSTWQVSGMPSKELRKEHPQQNFRAERDIATGQLPIEVTLEIKKEQRIQELDKTTLRSSSCQVRTRLWKLDRSRRNNISLWNPTWSRQVTSLHSASRFISSLVRLGLCSHLFSHSKPSENLKVYQGFINTEMLIRSQVRRLFGPLHSSTSP